MESTFPQGSTLPSWPALRQLTFEAVHSKKAALRFLLWFSLLMCFLNVLIEPIQWSDAVAWLPLTRDFFGYIGDSPARHRPLFAFLAYLTFVPISTIIDGIYWVLESQFQWVAPYEFPLTLLPTSAVEQLHRWIVHKETYPIILSGWLFRVQNLITYVASIQLGYLAIEKLTGSPRKAFFFALFILSSNQLYFWLSHTLINTQGFFILYVSMWLLADYFRSDKTEQPKKLFYYGLIYGLLMLGKQQYNIAMGLGIFALVFERTYFKEACLFLIYQAIPQLLWIGILHVGFHSFYANYEIGSRDLLSNWIQMYGSLPGISHMIGTGLFTAFKNIQNGLGTLALISTATYMGYRITQVEGKLLWSYFFATALFLQIVAYTNVRHAGDYAPIAFMGIACYLDYLASKVKPRIFWPAFSVGMLGWLVINMGLIESLRFQ